MIIRYAMERIVYFEGAQARRKYGGEMVLRVVDGQFFEIDGSSDNVARRDGEISCNCDYVDRGGQAVDTLTR